MIANVTAPADGTITGKDARKLLAEILSGDDARKTVAQEALRKITLNPWDHAILVQYGYLDGTEHEPTPIMVKGG